WSDMASARTFMSEQLPFWEMEPNDGLMQDSSEFEGLKNQVQAQVFAKAGEIYAIYLPCASNTGTLDLRDHPQRFQQQWFNPRTGDFVGPEALVEGGRLVPLGKPPNDPSEDWVVLFKRHGVQE
ncbi:MAG: hypothetical protein KDA52_09075, partial [Planctomycetaceae bacterium]|nr:hypothetical protein [Planctomycetaceae bacterium]